MLTDAELTTLSLTIGTQLEIRQAAVAKRDAAEKEVQAATVAIKGAMTVLEVSRFEAPLWVANFIPTKRESLSKSKLMAKGVPADVIAECMDVVEVEQLRVSPRKA